MRVIVRILAAILIVLGASPVSAAVKTRGPLVLHPKWRSVASSGVERVLVSGRYVYIGSGTGPAVLIDEHTGSRVKLTPPTGCYFDNANSVALGGRWLVATCNPPPPGPRYLYELYSIPSGTWTSFSPDVTHMFAFNADCKTGDPQCSASYAAIGDRWIEFQVTCGYHCGPTSFSFQNLQGGRVEDQPAGWKPGGTEIPDLNSPTLTRALCRPLKVPSGFTDLTTGQTLPGTIDVYGQFAVARRWSVGNLHLYTYVERCASRRGRSIDPNDWPIAASERAVIWMTGYRRPTLNGLLLPTLRRLRLTMPPAASLAALSATHIWAIKPNGRLYEAAAPTG